MSDTGETLFVDHRSEPVLVIGLLGIGFMALMLPAILNGFPILMGDSFRYLAEATGTYNWASSQFYGYFLGLVGGLGLWAVVCVQALLVAFVVYILLRHCCGASRIESGVTILALALTTPVSLYSSLIMTDVIFGVGIIAMIVLLVGLRSLVIELAMTAIVTYAAMAHPAALPLVVVTFAIGAIFLVARRVWRGTWQRVRGVVLIAVALAFAFAGLIVNNAVIWGNPSPSPHTAVVAFAYFLSHGDLEEELEGCSEWAMCEVTERPSPGINSFNQFLFRPDSFLWRQLGGPTEFADEARQIVIKHVTSHPLEFCARTLSSARQQLSLVNGSLHATRLMTKVNRGHAKSVGRFNAKDFSRFRKSRQYNKVLDLEWHDDIGKVAGWLGVLMVAFGVGGWYWVTVLRGATWPNQRQRRVQAAALLFAMYILHALVVGIATYPAQRYGGRVVWLLGLAFWIGAMEVRVLIRSRKPRSKGVA